MANVYGTTAPTGEVGNDAAPISLLANVTTSTAAQLVGFRYYTPTGGSAGAVTFRLFDVAAGFPWSPLIEHAAPLNAATGWHVYTIPTPIDLAAGGAYQVSIAWATGNSTYTARPQAFPVTNGQLSVTDSGFRTGAQIANYDADPDGSDFYLDIETGTAPPVEEPPVEEPPTSWLRLVRDGSLVPVRLGVATDSGLDFGA
jgi:hypothetical protein